MQLHPPLQSQYNKNVNGHLGTHEGKTDVLRGPRCLCSTSHDALIVLFKKIFRYLFDGHYFFVCKSCFNYLLYLLSVSFLMPVGLFLLIFLKEKYNSQCLFANSKSVSTVVWKWKFICIVSIFSVAKRCLLSYSIYRFPTGIIIKLISMLLGSQLGGGEIYLDRYNIFLYTTASGKFWGFGSLT